MEGLDKMDVNDYWLKFAVSGKPKDYILYAKMKAKKEELFFEDGNRRLSDKRNENGGSRPLDNPSYKG